MVSWTRAVAVFTFFLVVTSAVSDWFIYQQYKVANDSQVDTRAQLRAVITYTGGSQQVANGKDGKPAYYAIAPTFQNFGGTRTAHFVGWTNVRFFEGKIPENMDFNKPADKIDLAESVIGPNSIYQFQPITVSIDQIEKAKRQEGTILLWGHAEWSDIFSPEKMHQIGLCFGLNPSDHTTDGQTVLIPAPYRNDCNYNK